MKIVQNAAMQRNIEKTKDALSNKVDKVSGKSLSTNDYTTAEKNKLAGISTGAQANVIEGVQVNGTDLTITNKKVNVEIDLSGKVDKVSGKGLSTNDYTTAEKTKLAGIEEEANKYVHPTYSSATAGLYNITVDGTGHVSNKTAVTKANITALGIPAQDTTYDLATTTANGLMSGSDKAKLNTVEENANHYVHPTYTEKTNGFYKVTVDASGHVAGTAAVTKADITGLGIPASDTNTHYESKNVVGASTSTANTTTALTNGNVYLNSVENGAVTSTHKISGTGATTVTSDASGNIVVNSTNTTYSAATQSANGLMSAADKTKLDGVAANANNYTHPTGSGSNHIPSGGSAGQFLKWSSDGTAVWAADNNTTYSTMGAASASAAGTNGLVPAPAAGKQTSFLRGDGTWVVPTNTTYNAVTTSANGLMTAADKTKLDGIAEGANNYTHPTTSGNKHIPSGGSSGQILRWSADGTAAWGADNNTTYSAATTSAAGLMSAADKTKLDGVATGATANAASSTTPKAAGTAAVGTETTYARGDHVHPIQTTVSGNAGTATKLQTARTVSLTGAVTGSASFDGSADASITTTLANFDASKITSGTIDIARLPAGALERCVVVADDTARKALTTASVQLGDTVKVTSTGLMYMVVDESKLNSDDGYQVYTAGSASTAASADKATQLTNSRTLNIQDADGTNTGTGASFNGTANATIKLPSTIKASLTGNASTATKATQDSAGQQINTTYIKGLSASGKTVTYTKGDGTTGTITTQDTTYSTMGAATSSAAGSAGLVPAPAAGKQASFLRGDGTWIVPTNTTYSAATQSAQGLMTAADKTKLDGIETGATANAASSTTPKAAGTAAAGTETTFARGDHVHPLQTTISGNAATATKATQDSAGQQINTTYIKGLSVSGKTVTYTKGDGTTGTITTQDTDTHYASKNVVGSLTATANTTTALTNGNVYLNSVENGVITSAHKISGSGATTVTSDASGNIVVNSINTTYSAATTSAAGLMSAADKTKLDGVATGANAYTHPSHAAYSSGLYKITTNDLGHVTAATAVAKADITGLGIPASDTHYASKNVVGSSTATTNTTTALTNGNVYLNSVENNAVTSAHKISGSGATSVTSDTSGNIIISSTNTTYSAATTSANGLMSSTDKAKLDGIAASANNYSHPTGSGNNHIPSGGSSGQILRWASDGTATWGADNNTTYSVATTSANGLMSSTDKTKLDGITTGATANSASSTTPKAAGTAAVGSETTYARGDHVHPIQTTVSGNAGTATTLQTARTLTVGNTGKSFNGSANVSWGHNEIGVAKGGHASYSIAAGNAGWYRIATSSASISNCTGLFSITVAGSGAHSNAVLSAGTSYGVNDSTSMLCLSCHNYSTAAFTKARIVYHTTYSSNYAYLEIYKSSTLALTVTVNASNMNGWSLLTTSTAGSIPSGYSNKELALTQGQLTSSNSLGVSITGSAASATKATQDSAGQQINTTYIKGLSVSGTTITYTKGDGATGTITTQDTNTTYSVATTSANGLMSSTDKTKLDGIATGANAYTHPTTSGNKHIPSGGSSGQFLKWSADGTATWAADNNTTYSAGTGLSLSSTTFSLATSGVTAGTKGPTANVSGTNGTTIKVPKITVDTYGRVTALEEYTYTSVDNNTTYSVATTSAAGLMSASDKSKLNNINTTDIPLTSLQALANAIIALIPDGTNVSY